MKTPKSARKAKAETPVVETATPVKMKTPKKPKTPKAEVAAAETPKKAKSPKADKAVAGTPKAQNGQNVNGESKPAGHPHRAPKKRYVRKEDPKAVFIRFQDGISTEVAAALMESFKDAESAQFGRGFIVHLKSESAAAELIKNAPSMDFAGEKPNRVENAYEVIVRPEGKRTTSEDAAAAPPKKQKVENSAKVGKKAKVEEEEEMEEDDDDEEEEEEEEGDEEEDDDDDDDDEEDDEDDDDDDEEDDDDDE